MEEVDAILLSQLREIGCDLDDDVVGISNLDSVQVMKCVAECLWRILSESNDLEHLPKANMISEAMNMSIKYKHATSLSTAIQDLGYKSEIGYQTFMYGNEHEIRRMFLFLIERIPRDDERTSDAREGVDQATSGSLLQRLKNANVSTIWIPYSSCDTNEFDDDDDEQCRYDAQSDWHDRYSSKPVNPNSVYTASTIGFRISSFLSKAHAKPLQRYAKYKLAQKSDVECDDGRNLLLPQSVMDILEWNSNFFRSSQLDDDDVDSRPSAELFDAYLLRCRSSNKKPITFVGDHDDHSSFMPIEIEKKSNNINLDNDCANDQTTEKTDEIAKKELTQEEIYEQYLEKLRQTIGTYDQQIVEMHEKENQLAQCEAEYQSKCKLFEANYKSQEELEEGIATTKSQIEEIASTWDAIQRDLHAELKSKKSQTTAQSDEYREKLKRISQLKKAISSKVKEIQSKETLVSELQAKTPDQWPPSRASYTRRIIEIIGNVRKQNDETKKVLTETKQIQKDINTLNGKIERIFAVSEDVIYREAKSNEWSRKCYKSLALLQTTFDQLLESVSIVGAHLREIRQLEEMVDNEKARKAVSNLSRINADLEQIKLENAQLKTKLKTASSSAS